MRTEYTSPSLLSLRVNEYDATSNDMLNITRDNIKVIAFLVDQQTICVRDLVANTANTINHTVSIDFLELNTRGNIVVFRDTNRNLYLFKVVSQVKTLLLNQSAYAQWIPDSDVLVAQSKDIMLVWYNINALDQVRYT